MSTVDKAFRVIEIISELAQAGIHEISKATGYPPSTVHRILTILMENGYAVQDPTTKAYALSLRFFELGARVQENFNIIPFARPHLNALKETTKESINLAVLDGDEAVYLDHLNSEFGLQLFTKLGARVPLYSTGVGKVFLSQLSEDALEQYLRRTVFVPFTENTLIDPDGILRELAAIREQGFAIDNEENEKGSRCVATLIFYHNHKNAAALSVSGPTIRITPDRYASIGEIVRKSARDIVRSLGYSKTGM